MKAFDQSETLKTAKHENGNKINNNDITNKQIVLQVLSNANHASQNGGNVPKPSSQSHNGGFTSGLSDLFSRTTSRDFDWI